jgi:hypothetical protein
MAQMPIDAAISRSARNFDCDALMTAELTTYACPTNCSIHEGNNMRNIVKTFVLTTMLTAVAAPPTAHAAGAVISAKITSMSVQSTQFALVLFSNTIASKPSCHTGGNAMVIDVTTSKGKALLSLAQTAMLADLFVTAVGTGGCTNVGTSNENLSSLSVTR